MCSSPAKAAVVMSPLPSLACSQAPPNMLPKHRNPRPQRALGHHNTPQSKGVLHRSLETQATLVEPAFGYATLIRAQPEVRANVDVFEPLKPEIERLTRGLKFAFDPDGLLNRGRMYANL